jgi:hypothetical protein
MPVAWWEIDLAIGNHEIDCESAHHHPLKAALSESLATPQMAS